MTTVGVSRGVGVVDTCDEGNACRGRWSWWRPCRGGGVPPALPSLRAGAAYVSDCSDVQEADSF